MLVGDCRDVVDMDVTMGNCLTVPDVIKDRAVVAMVGLDAVRMGEETLMDCDGECGEDRERYTWEDWCDSAFRNGYSGFPPDSDDPLPQVVFSSLLFWNEDVAEPSRMLSDYGDVPVSAIQGCADTIVPLVPPDTDVRFDNNELALMNSRIGEVSVLSLEICDPSIHSHTLDVGISDGDTEWLCLLYFARPGSTWDNSVEARVDCTGLDHWRGIVWDPGIVGQQCLCVCYDCLCLMALFCDAMLWVQDWAALSTSTGTDTGYCRTITWELGCLGSINPPCDVDHFFGRDDWQIKELVVVVTPGGGYDIRFQRCACVHGTSVGVNSRECFRSC